MISLLHQMRPRPPKEEIMPESAAKSAWMRAHTVVVSIKLNRSTDADILGRLDGLENRQGYIKALIRADIKKEEKK